MITGKCDLSNDIAKNLKVFLSIDNLDNAIVIFSHAQSRYHTTNILII